MCKGIILAQINPWQVLCSSDIPYIWLAQLKFELTSQDSAGGKNFTVLMSMYGKGS